ncbi:PEP/pyruvate-binding domain-containing protein [Desulfatiglans anilini]|uniref:PEP/pyruvate-binding domain-containing protein n=1 Tax=Desulfatiglans anilini TaxID=90728 RepID=UPI00042213BA|nr:PEP/pyruvate-binding domain-containing protein [Desulfatiglans anilini]
MEKQPPESCALEVNLACTRVDVTVDERYRVIERVMAKYPGLKEGLETYLEEVCHPYRNWAFIVKETRGYALNYFHALKTHPEGVEAAGVYCDIFFMALGSAGTKSVKQDAADNLLVLLQKIIREGVREAPAFYALLDRVFESIRCLEEGLFRRFVRSFYRINRLGRELIDAGPPDCTVAALRRLLADYYRAAYDEWMAQPDPLEWFRAEAAPDTKAVPEDAFADLQHARLAAAREDLEQALRSSEEDGLKPVERILALPGYGEIVAAYEAAPRAIEEAGGGGETGRMWKLWFLLHMMDLEGLAVLHEEILREINRTLVRLIEHEGPERVREALEKTFTILKRMAGAYPGTALTCVLNLGQAVYKTGDCGLILFFQDHAIGMGFEAPDFRGVTDEWQLQANDAHVQNIRTWLGLIECEPRWSRRLLSALIVHLGLSGVLIRDTDLFPRDITALLNSGVRPVYNLVKQLARLFPSYFNDIGAEGPLRDVSTRLDEITRRDDALVHFVRKQSHVESSNRIVGLMEGLLHYWLTREKIPLEPYVPLGLYERLGSEGPFLDGVHAVLSQAAEAAGARGVEDLLEIPDETIAEASDVDPKEAERVRLAIRLYRLLFQKYEHGYTDLESYLGVVRPGVLPGVERLREALHVADPVSQLEGLLDHLEELKDLILSDERFEAQEDIYHKRHFAVDIPSTYGSYHEPKFDALGLTFRLEALVNVRFENLLERIELGFVTRGGFREIRNTLRLFTRALAVDGILSQELERQLDLLDHSLAIRGFSAGQYVDIFQGFSRAVGNIVQDYFNNIHQENLLRAASEVPLTRILPRFRDPQEPEGGEADRTRLAQRISEIFLRDRIASSLGLQPLDRLIGRILDTLRKQAAELPPESLRLLLDYEPQRAVTPFHPVKPEVKDVIHLGSKGLNLVRIQELGLPVPPGFIVTTDVFRGRELVRDYEPVRRRFEADLRRGIARLEEETGRGFGRPEKPLLLAVRSGASISLPGMMTTFLNIGLDETIVQRLAEESGNAWFAWDTFRRLQQSFGMAGGIARDRFDDLMEEHKAGAGVRHKREFSDDRMKDLALAYAALVRGQGILVPDEPMEQLMAALHLVFDSWFAPKAAAYRKIMGISDDWGTAVTVQGMVFGNRSRDSGAGVLFTHSPRMPADMVRLWGDFTPGNQGEDVVSGLVTTLPVSEQQAAMEDRAGEGSLETLFPEIYLALKRYAERLIDQNGWTPQEMEFTFEGPQPERLYFLQTRDMGIRERKQVQAFDIADGEPPRVLGHGVGVSGGAMVGRVVFKREEIADWRQREPETPLVLVRGDTVPDDIVEIHEADGLLTARGGATSHAAIVAHRLGKTCVVGCTALVCMEKDSACSLDRQVLNAGDWISLDGRSGTVYLGKLKVRTA